MNSNNTAVEGSMDTYTTLRIFSTNIYILASEICGNLGRANFGANQTLIKKIGIYTYNYDKESVDKN